MKRHPGTIIGLLLTLVFTTPLFAQEKKRKAAVSPDNEKAVIITKHKQIDSIHQAAQMPVKKHRSDSLYQENKEGMKKQKPPLSLKPDPWKNAKTKKIVMSIPCRPDARISLQNIMHKITILTTDDDKVMLVVTVDYQGASSLTDKEWFSKLKLSLRGEGANVEVKSGYSATESTGEDSGPKLDTIFNGVTLFDSLGNATARRSYSDRPLLLYLPKGARLNIESKYADVTLEDAVDSVDASITNGRLNLMDAMSLRTTGVYARINAANIRSADITVVNGSLKAKKIDTLTIASKNSFLVLKKVDRLTVTNSQADQFDIEEAGTIVGQKAYGGLTLSSLNGSVDLEGVNADVKIKRIKSSASAIKLKTQYAALQLPVSELKDYEVRFEGTGGKVSTPFERMNVTQTSFHAKVGGGKATSFLLKCNNCTVDFN